MNKTNLNLKWSYQIATILSSVGIKYACICPGSRNSALTIGFTDNPNFITSSHIDERSAGYFALGISKKNNIPTVVITTSGTAVANLFPSIIESNLSKEPINESKLLDLTYPEVFVKVFWQKNDFGAIWHWGDEIIVVKKTNKG